MNRYAALACLGLGLMVSPLLGGIGRSAVPEGTKIAVVDLRSLLDTTPAGKRTKEAFDKSQKAKQATLSKGEDELKKTQDDLIKRKLARIAAESIAFKEALAVFARSAANFHLRNCRARAFDRWQVEHRSATEE